MVTVCGGGCERLSVAMATVCVGGDRPPVVMVTGVSVSCVECRSRPFGGKTWMCEDVVSVAPITPPGGSEWKI